MDATVTATHSVAGADQVFAEMQKMAVDRLGTALDAVMRQVRTELGLGELPPRAGWICRTVVVVRPTPSAVAPMSETTPPSTLAAPSAAAGNTCPRELTVRL